MVLGSQPRILFINHWARHLGGAELSLVDVLAYTVQRGAEVHLSVSEDGALVERARRLGVVCHITSCHSTLGYLRRSCVSWLHPAFWLRVCYFLAYVLRLSRLINRLNPDVVHSNVPKSHLAFMIATRIGGWKGSSVVHLREIFPQRSFVLLLYAALIPPTTRIIAISHAVAARLPPSLRQRTIVIYNGVAIPVSIGSRSAPPPHRLLYMGRIVPWKGCHTLVDIFARLITKYPHLDATLSLIGDTTYWSQSYRTKLMRQITAAGICKRCTLSPATDDPYTTLQSHHIFCNASFEEPFGRSIAEAQACGLPVVAFDSGGVHEIVVHNVTGLLVPYDDRPAFAEAVSTLLTDRQRMIQMGIAACKRAAEHFDRDLQIPKIIDAILAGCCDSDSVDGADGHRSILP